MDKDTQNVELGQVIRENAHKNAGLFGDVVSSPARELEKLMIESPESFTVEERRLISTIHANAIADAQVFQLIGKPLREQLKCVDNAFIPHIRENVNSYNRLLGNRNLNNVILMWLRQSVAKSDELIEGLGKFDSANFGNPEPFVLSRFLKGFITERNSRFALLGEASYYTEYFFGEGYPAEVMLNPESFKTHVLCHIFDNFDKHAFCGPEFESGGKGKHVRVDFYLDKTETGRMDVLIRNNGRPFRGDTEAVFENGVGHGTGIGLFSARRFLAASGGTVRMITYDDDEFTVGININLPIYGITV